MDTQDMPLFFAALNEMGALFCDELSEERQALYWKFFCDTVSLEEWQYGCEQAMLRETFYKVPLPSVMVEYAREYRKATQADRQRTTTKVKELREDQMCLEEIRALTAKIWRDDRLKDPPPPYETEAP